MKIERISDNQVKFILNQCDLQERDIKLSELAYGSKKTQELFREMMEVAMEECDFYTDSSPLIIEAIPVSGESIVIIVTKVSSPEEIENKFNLPQQQLDALKRQRHELEQETVNTYKNISIFAFNTLDDATNASLRIVDIFSGNSTLFKLQGLYMLILENETEILYLKELEGILSEYGQKHISTEISKQHVIEYGEPIIKGLAVSILASI